MSNGMPKYVNLPGSYTYPPPFPIQNTNIQAFLLRASHERLKAVTDQWLNSMPGSPYRYEPLLPFVVCAPMWLSRITCSQPGWAEQGWMHETDFNFAYMVAAYKGEEIDHLATAIPYLIIDNPATVITGREVYGYRKVFGTMTYVNGTYQPSAVSTWVYKKFDPNEEFAPAQIAAIIPPPGWGAATRQANWEDIRQIAKLVVEDIAADVAVAAIERLIKYLGGLNIVSPFLLQNRDVVDPNSAAYQALIEASLKVTSFNSAWFLPDGFTVQLTDYASYPVVKDLGIEVDDNLVAKSLLSFQVNFDCISTLGTVLAVAGRTSTS